METCANCGKVIGPDTDANVWCDEVVCGRCRAAFERQASGKAPVIPPPLPKPLRFWQKPVQPGHAVLAVLGLLVLMAVVAGSSEKEPTRSAPTAAASDTLAGFSAWDGSHHATIAAIKKTMHDPSTFEHVETTYWDMGGKIVVRTQFRGKNGFGATRLSSIKSECDRAGNFLRFQD